MLMSHKLIAQRYFEIILDTTSLDSCAVGVSLERHNLTPSSQFVYGHHEPFRLISNSSVLTNVCKGSKIIVSTMDSNCVALDNMLYIHPNSSKQIILDTIIIVMPSSSTACDGSLTFKFKHVGPLEMRSYGNSTMGGATTDSVFTGLCEDRYFYGVTHPGHTTYDFYIQLDLYSGTPTPCNPFDISVAMSPSASPGCDGSLVITPNEGTVFDYNYYVFDYCCMMNSSASANYANNLCSGPYTVYLESPGNSYRYLSRGYYVDTLLTDSTWGAPPIVSPATDTILVPSIFNCSLDYSIPLDTVYLDHIEYAGAGVYEFFVMVVQGADTITLNESAIIDTSHNLFIDVTVYCDDSSMHTRSGVGATGALRNMVYRGGQSLTSVNNDEFNPLNEILVFPNPANLSLWITSKKSYINLVEVINLNGEIVQSLQFQDKSCLLDLKKLPESVYILKVIDSKGEIYFDKFIKL